MALKASIGMCTISAMWRGMESTRWKSRKRSRGPMRSSLQKPWPTRRWKLFGTSAAGRYLVVVFTIRDKLLRPVTAHTINQREREIYAPKIGKTE
jgi:uncharacterized DUF497 family protein